MKKYYAFLLTVLVSVLCGCSDNKEETEEKTEIVQVIEGTCIVRAKDREKETLDSTTTVENAEIIEDAETIIVENTETVDEESNKSETTVLEEKTSDKGNVNSSKTETTPSQTTKPS